MQDFFIKRYITFQRFFMKQQSSSGSSTVKDNTFNICNKKTFQNMSIQSQRFEHRSFRSFLTEKKDMSLYLENTNLSFCQMRRQNQLQYRQKQSLINKFEQYVIKNQILQDKITKLEINYGNQQTSHQLTIRQHQSLKLYVEQCKLYITSLENQLKEKILKINNKISALESENYNLKKVNSFLNEQLDKKCHQYNKLQNQYGVLSSSQSSLRQLAQSLFSNSQHRSESCNSRKSSLIRIYKNKLSISVSKSDN